MGGIRYRVQVNEDYDPKTKDLRKVRWSLYGEGEAPICRDSVLGDSFLVRHEFREEGGFSLGIGSRKLEVSNTKIVFGRIDHPIWEGAIGFNFWDIGDTSRADIIELGRGFSEIPYPEFDVEEHYRFYHGTRYFNEYRKVNPRLDEVCEDYKPDIQETGYLVDELKFFPEEGRLVNDMFALVDRFHGSFRYRVMEDRGRSEIDGLEREVRELTTGILDSGVVQEHPRNTAYFL